MELTTKDTSSLFELRRTKDILKLRVSNYELRVLTLTKKNSAVVGFSLLNIRSDMAKFSKDLQKIDAKGKERSISNNERCCTSVKKIISLSLFTLTLFLLTIGLKYRTFV